MALVPYPEISCADGPDVAYGIYGYLKTNGWADVARGDGSTRYTDALTSVTDLANTNAWYVVRHTSSGVYFHAQRGSVASQWTWWYTDANGTLVEGSGSAPDLDATYSKIIHPNGYTDTQFFPTAAPTAMKVYFAVDDTYPAFAVIARRTPFPGGSACMVLFIDHVVTPVTWPANPAPQACCAYFDNTNAVDTYCPIYIGGWWGRGTAGEAYSTTMFTLENSVFSGGTVYDPSGKVTEYETRIVGGNWTNYPGMLGLGQLGIKWIRPYTGPLTGLNTGTSFARMCFGTFTIANNGTAPTS